MQKILLSTLPSNICPYSKMVMPLNMLFSFIITKATNENGTAYASNMIHPLRPRLLATSWGISVVRKEVVISINIKNICLLVMPFSMPLLPFRPPNRHFHIPDKGIIPLFTLPIPCHMVNLRQHVYKYDKKIYHIHM